MVTRGIVLAATAVWTLGCVEQPFETQESIAKLAPDYYLHVHRFQQTSAVAPHPRVELTVPEGYKIIGGGAIDSTPGAGNMLTASYPRDTRTWIATGKDHIVSSPASITAYVIAIHDPFDYWSVQISATTSATAHHPQAIALTPFAHVLTGGGASTNSSGAGQLLTASFPNSDGLVWEARSKDHGISDSGSVTAYAIGLRSTQGLQLQGLLQPNTSEPGPYPSVLVGLPMAWTLTGGGAYDDWNGSGNLLTASYPTEDGFWFAAGKDHLWSSPASITSYAIGVRIIGP